MYRCWMVLVIRHSMSQCDASDSFSSMGRAMTTMLQVFLSGWSSKKVSSNLPRRDGQEDWTYPYR